VEGKLIEEYENNATVLFGDINKIMAKNKVIRPYSPATFLEVAIKRGLLAYTSGFLYKLIKDTAKGKKRVPFLTTSGSTKKRTLDSKEDQNPKLSKKT
jgi:hypothetical protein